MADPPRNSPEARAPAGSRSAHPALLIFTAVALLISIGLLWKVWQQSTALEARLSDTERRAGNLAQNLEESRQETALVKAESEAATAQAAETAELARRSRDARIRAELERELAREDADRSRQETGRAREEAAEMRAEAERLRKQREQELDRMQQALNRITETRRTPMGMVVNLGEDSFLFDFDNDTLRPENREMLSRIAGVLLASHGFRLQVYGHTDDLGPAVYNKDLSLRRARAVGQYIVTAGVPEELVEVEGLRGNKSAHEIQVVGSAAEEPPCRDWGDRHDHQLRARSQESLAARGRGTMPHFGDCHPFSRRLGINNLQRRLSAKKG